MERSPKNWGDAELIDEDIVIDSTVLAGEELSLVKSIVTIVVENTRSVNVQLKISIATYAVRKGTFKDFAMVQFQ